MEFRTIDLTILSATNLKKVTHLSKTAAYVVVSVTDSSSYDQNTGLQKQKTQVDKHGDRNPTWNYSVSFTVPEAALRQNRMTLLFQVYTKRLFPLDKLIGEVHVPVSDIITECGDGKGEAADIVTMSYQVRKGSQPRGALNFSCKVGEKFERVEPRGSVRTVTAYPYVPPPVYQPMYGAPVQGYYPPPMQQAGYGYDGHGNGYGYRYGNGNMYGGRMGGFGGMGGGRNNFGMGLGAGLLGGALGGMLIGEMMSDASYDGAYDGGFDGGFDGGGFDGGGFDF